MSLENEITQVLEEVETGSSRPNNALLRQMLCAAKTQIQKDRIAKLLLSNNPDVNDLHTIISKHGEFIKGLGADEYAGLVQKFGSHELLKDVKLLGISPKADEKEVVMEDRLKQWQGNFDGQPNAADPESERRAKLRRLIQEQTGRSAADAAASWWDEPGQK
jgi:hypothetical protein